MVDRGLSEDELLSEIRRVKQRMLLTRVVGALIIVAAIGCLALPRGATVVLVGLVVVGLLAIFGVGVPSMFRLRALQQDLRALSR